MGFQPVRISENGTDWKSMLRRITASPQKDAINLDCGNSLPLCLAAHGILFGTMTAHNEH